MNFKILSMTGGDKMHAGQIITYDVNVLPLIRMKWVTEITEVKEPYSFVDEQRSGPYRLWRHTHSFIEVEGGVDMTDEVVYALPLGPIGRLMHWLLVRRQVNAIFDHRYKLLETYKPFHPSLFALSMVEHVVVPGVKD